MNSCCYILDDASRKVLASGEFDHKTTENALVVLKQVICECVSWNYPILVVFTDQGLEFYANRRDAKGHVDHEYEVFLKDQVLCRFCVG